MDAVCTATQVLEDSPRTNAGFGSSLTAEGRCGAMSGDRGEGRERSFQHLGRLIE